MPTKPNLLLFMPETLRADAFYGPKEARARTPNFDRFAESGVAFTSAYAQMSYCTPSRCGMFTGLYPHTMNHRSIWYLLQRGERNFFQDLKEAGYKNVVFGKNDLLDDSWAAECFDEYTRRHEQRRGAVEPPPEDSPLRKLMYAGRRTGDWFDNDDACVQSALDFLDEDHQQPWCLFLPLSFAHPSYTAEEPWFSMHDRSLVPTPIPAAPERKRGYAQVLYDLHGGEGQTEEALREVKALYFGMTSRVDHHFGMVLDKLEERGLADDTIVVFFTDHGDYAGDHGLAEKYMGAFEECMLHVPLAFRVPGATAKAHGALCEMTDLYPTFMDLLGLEPKHYHFGRSLAPLITGQATEHRDVVFAEGGRNPDETHFPLAGLAERTDYYGDRVRFQAERPECVDRAIMARTKQHKYIYSATQTDELYDMERDPHEQNNVAADPAYATVVHDLRERCLKWLVETSDTTPFEQTKRNWPRPHK